MGNLMTFLIFISSLAMAHGSHNPQPAPVSPVVTPEEVCQGEASEALCAHIHFSKNPDSLNESSFILHFETANELEVQNLKVELWMEMEGGHGHGSAPVVMQRVSKNKYKISNAWFVMMGTWSIRTHFDLGTTHHKLDIPVNIFQ